MLVPVCPPDDAFVSERLCGPVPAGRGKLQCPEHCSGRGSLNVQTVVIVFPLGTAQVRACVIGIGRRGSCNLVLAIWSIFRFLGCVSYILG